MESTQHCGRWPGWGGGERQGVRASCTDGLPLPPHYLRRKRLCLLENNLSCSDISSARREGQTDRHKGSISQICELRFLSTFNTQITTWCAAMPSPARPSHVHGQERCFNSFLQLYVQRGSIRRPRSSPQPDLPPTFIRLSRYGGGDSDGGGLGGGRWHQFTARLRRRW